MGAAAGTRSGSSTPRALGDDGFGYGGFAQFNSFNNVVWRNDPDHIEISRADGYRAATITSLTGSLLMLTDRPEVYRSDRVEAARRTAPVLFTLPGQVYDIDPTRISRLSMVEHEVSGSGPRPFEADQRLQQTLYQLDIARPFERWTVLARTAGAPDTHPRRPTSASPAGKDYVAFDFWKKRFLGVFRDTLVARSGRSGVPGAGGLPARAAAAPAAARDQSARELRRRGSRARRWNGDSLSGTSRVVTGDDYELYVTEPDGWTAESVDGRGRRGRAGREPRPLARGNRARRANSAGEWTIRFRRTR